MVRGVSLFFTPQGTAVVARAGSGARYRSAATHSWKMPRYKATRDFAARALNGDSWKRISAGEELIFIRWMGEEHKQSAIFALSVKDPLRGTNLGPLYEVEGSPFAPSRTPG